MHLLSYSWNLLCTIESTIKYFLNWNWILWLFQLREESLFTDDQHLDLGRDSISTMKSPDKISQSLQLDAPLQDDGFGADLGSSDLQSGGLFEGGGLFDEPTMGEGMPPVEEQDSTIKSPGNFLTANTVLSTGLFMLLNSFVHTGVYTGYIPSLYVRHHLWFGFLKF